VKVVRGTRDSPRNSDLALQDQERLLDRRRELIRLRKDPIAFIGSVFRSHDRIWVERCSAIVREK
jgi:hypothetical protein